MIQVIFNSQELKTDDAHYILIKNRVPFHLKKWIDTESNINLKLKVGLGLGVAVELMEVNSNRPVFAQKKDVPSANNADETELIHRIEIALNECFDLLMYDLIGSGYFHSKKVQDRLYSSYGYQFK